MASNPPSSAHVTVSGLRLHYLAWGPEDGSPLVMLHGATWHAASWRRLAEALPERRVFALDQRGHGDSDWAPVYGSRHLVADVEGFAKAAGLSRFDLLGMSMGGVAAFAFAGSHPASVDRLVVIDAGPEFAPEGIARISAAQGEPDVFASEEEAVVQGRVANPVPADDVLRERVVANLKPAAGGGLTWKHDTALRDGTATREDYQRRELWELWEAVQAPTLLVRGGISDMLSAETAEQMTARQPSSRLMTIADSGHTVPLDRPQELAAAVQDFLNAS
jgi:pimeloyl-ACP methyl ester carboxylesterase